GANWTYVTWGLYHALLFVPLILLGRTKAYTGVATWKQIPQIVLTFGLVTIGWVVFRATSIIDALNFMMSWGRHSLLSIPNLIGRWYYIPMSLSLIGLIVVEWYNRGNAEIETFSKIKSKFVRWCVYLSLIAIIAIYGFYESTQFIYFQF
ncbi:MAG: hypothetical protein MJZ92_04455, partial [Paludibacteraceae bacterium]|nr:hypothetical protein [Paludibacteraceae bacterium]